jgi:hypothetical protein
MKLGFWIGCLLAALLALPAVGCFGPAFSAGTGGGSSASSASGSSSSTGTGGGCPGTEKQCPSGCTDTQTDSSNCGTCGNQCAVASQCTAGACVCQSPTTKCTSGCVDLTSNTQNCGTCGHACTSGQGCNNSVCGMCSGTVCSAPTGCVDTENDPDNCGTCGHACTGYRTCQAGLCQCPSGSADCGSGTCTNTAYDPLNCGGCANAADGGVMGKVCGATQVCNDNQCACRPGLKNCNNICVDTAADPTACAPLTSGGLMCPASLGMCSGLTPVCQAGSCAGACLLGATTKETNCSNGCYTDAQLANSAENCGACGKQCPAGQVCAASTCEDYVVPPGGCSACPCAACPSTASTCCTVPATLTGGSPLNYCVNGTCPTFG